jgi:hypothetical protein
MNGCRLDDRLLMGWERALLAAVQRPQRRGGRLVWNLDTVPPATLRALCWARREAA